MSLRARLLHRVHASSALKINLNMPPKLENALGAGLKNRNVWSVIGSVLFLTATFLTLYFNTHTQPSNLRICDSNISLGEDNFVFICRSASSGVFLAFENRPSLKGFVVNETGYNLMHSMSESISDKLREALNEPIAIN